MITDWKLMVAGKILPAHSQIVAMASKLFFGMYQDARRPRKPIEPPGSSTTTLAQALALLRFMYDRESVATKNIHHLSLHNNLGGVLRLANSINRPLLEKLKGVAKELVVAGPPPQAGSSSADAASSSLVNFNLIKDVRNFALDIKDNELQEACYTYVAKRCNYITAQATEAASIEDATSLVRDFSDYPDLLRAALFCDLLRNPKYTGKTIRRMVDVQNHIPAALLTCKFQVKGAEDPERLVPIGDANDEQYEYKGCHYNFSQNFRSFSADKTGYFLFLTENKSDDPPRPRIDAKVCCLNWTDPSKSLKL
ncbi:hypothetical protein Ndes2437B_g05332 [Nannochloris sp. 'desiccata']